jgi:hypothetical protein
MKWPGRFGNHPRPVAVRRLEFIRRFWDEALDRLESYLHELRQKENNHDPGKQHLNGHDAV